MFIFFTQNGKMGVLNVQGVKTNHYLNHGGVRFDSMFYFLNQI
jgi:hypothetical protein